MTRTNQVIVTKSLSATTSGASIESTLKREGRMFDKFTRNAYKVLRKTEDEARRLGHNDVGPEFILLGLMRVVGTIPYETLKSLGLRLSNTRQAVKSHLGRKSDLLTPEAPFTPSAKDVLKASWDEASNAGVSYVGSEHLFLALLGSNDSSMRNLFDALAIDTGLVRQKVLTEIEQFKERIQKLATDSLHTEVAEATSAVIHRAQAESRRLSHNFVGSEQLLLGLFGDETEIAAKALKTVGLNFEDTRREVEELIGHGEDIVGEEIPFTPRVRIILLYSWEEARALGDSFLNTGHLLLAIIREGDGIAARILENLAIDLNELRAVVYSLMNTRRN